MSVKKRFITQELYNFAHKWREAFRKNNKHDPIGMQCTYGSKRMFCTDCAPNFMPKSGGSFRCESKQKRYGFICQLSHHLFHSDLSFSLISWPENMASMDLNDSRNTCWSLSSSTCCALAYSSERRKKVRGFFNLLVNINTQEAPGQLCLPWSKYK